MEKPTDRFICFDVETTGAFLPGFKVSNNQLLAIGYCVIDLKRTAPISYKIVHTDLCVLHVPGPDRFEKRCWDEFWTKDGAPALEKLRKHPNPLQEAEAAIWIRDALRVWQNFEGQVHMCSDNPAFDFAWIDNLVSRYIAIPPVSQYSVVKKNCYTRPLDIKSAALAALELKGYDSPWRQWNVVSKTFDVAHDHSPQNDAQNILETHIKIMYF